MLAQQIIWLFVLALPIACIAWTVTHEQVFVEPRKYCVRQSRENKRLLVRKIFYLFTCEYCFSHYITIFFLIITGYTLLLPGWKGYLIGGFALVWVSNVYMSLFGLLRQAIKAEKTKINLEEKIIENHEQQSNGKAKAFEGKRTLLPKRMRADYWKDM